MPRIDVLSKQSDGNPHWVDLKHPDAFMAEDLFAMHRAVRIKQGPGGETEFSGQELADDRVNAFLGAAITGWSFQGPIPSQVSVAAPDKVIGRTMNARDWARLRREAQPYMDALEGEDLPDPKSGGSATDEGVPVQGEQAG